MKKTPLIFFFLLRISSVLSQDDSNYVYINNANIGEQIFRETDSTGSLFKNSYDPESIFILGNGSKEYTIQRMMSGYNNFGASFFHFFSKQELFISSNPVVRATYFVGTNKEQVFKINHHQQINQQFFYSVSYQKINNEGFFRNQLSVYDDLKAGIHFNSKKGNYRLNMVSELVKIKREENGGVVSDSSFEEREFRNYMLYETNLNSARNIKDKFSIFLENILPLGKDKHFYIADKIFMNSYERAYTDNPAEGFYSSIYYDSLVTNDKNLFNEFSNRFFTGYKFSDSSFIDAYMDVAYSEYQDIDFDTTTVNFRVGSKSEFYVGKSVFEKMAAFYYLSGYNEGDFGLESTTKVRVNKKNDEVEISAIFFRQQPLMNLLVYNSNNFKWRNDFEPQKEFNGSIKIKSSELKSELKLEFGSSDNFIYFNHFSSPEQYASSIYYYKSGLKNTIGKKKWKMENELIYQGTSNKEILRIPNFITKNTFSYSSSLWSMDFRAGITFFYYTSYYSHAWSPSLEEFYLQNDRKTGNYPFAGLFFEGKIKSVTLFAALDHANDGLLKRNYYSVLHYPMNPRTFRFGISWEFKD
ncbi:MAG: putative porin [Bacteroidota bacterium]